MAPSNQFADHTSVSDASPDLATPSQDPEVPEQVRDPARRRRRRLTRRGRLVRALIVVPLVVVLIWATASYAVWMLRPTSLSWSVNSVEWVRYNVPFGIGNWVADHVEQVYYSSQAPKKGGPQLKSLPKVGVRHPTAPATTPTTPRLRACDDCMAAGDHSGLLQPASRRRGLAADRTVGRWWCPHTGHDVSS